MPLRGKILNTWELEPGEIGSSQEVHDISVALGVDPGVSDLSQLRYHKVCILADADSDGQHIATLLCALFLRHFRPLVQNGHVHVAMPPLYRIDAGKQVLYALDDAERDATLERIKGEHARTKPVVTRFKGLGEMNPSQLRETTIDPRTRRLVQLTIECQGPDRSAHGHAAGQEARRRPARLAGAQRQSGRSGGLMAESKANFDGVEQRPLGRFYGEGIPRLFDVRDPRPRAAGARRRTQAGAATHYLRHERAWTFGGFQAQEIRAHGRRCDRQVPSAWRLGLLRSHGAHGAGFLVPLSDRRRPGQLGILRRSKVLRRDALHRIASDALCRIAARGTRTRHGRLGTELRRHDGRAADAAGAPAEPAAQRYFRHRCRHGDRHTAAQSARSGRGLRASARGAGRQHARAAQARQGPGSAHRRRDHLAARGPDRFL